MLSCKRITSDQSNLT